MKAIVNFGQKLNRSTTVNIVSFLFVSGLALFMLVPFIYSISNSLKPLDELFLYPPKIFVNHPTSKNYISLFSFLANSDVPFSRYLFNSLLVTITGTAGHLIVASLAAFVLAKFEFPGNNLIFKVVVLSLMFVPQVTAIPNYITMSQLKWVDTPLALIIPAFGSSLGLFLMKQFMESMIADDVLESARVDGANIMNTFFRVAMPMVKPAWLTLIIFSIQSLWNINSGTYIISEEGKTLSYMLSQIVSGGIARAGMGAAAAVIIMIVPITAFISSQSQIVETMTSSGIKG